MTRKTIAREALILLAFVGLTTAMTWPWALALRDAVADPGDPYMIAWSLWWSYHQTFSDPLNLFHANIFYPYRYTLAFSEHDYGIAVFLFPLFALGFRPLTAHSIATFLGFAFSGYGMFRLARTLTGSDGAAWVAGVAFAFVPYRFHVLSHLHYLFAGWMPLLLEALVLFARRRSWRRAAWLGVAFCFNALTSVTWFFVMLVPLPLVGLFLLWRYSLARDRAFWLRGAAALGTAALVLLPFMLPYHYVNRQYGFARSPQEVAVFSATCANWLIAEGRNRFWQGMGEGLFADRQHMLFPGLLPLLLSLFALYMRQPAARRGGSAPRRRVLILLLDALIVIAFVGALLMAGYGGLGAADAATTWRLGHPAVPLALGLLALIVRVVVARGVITVLLRWRSWPDAVRRSAQADALAIGLICALTGFFGSLGMNLFFYRWLYHYVPFFHSMRVPTRWAMLCYLGLALLAGLGAMRLAQRLGGWRPYARTALVYALLVCGLLIELRAAPLAFERGEADPDEISLRLRETPMRGGIVTLPVSGLTLHRAMLRSAEHARPLVNASSSFVSPVSYEIGELSQRRPIPPRFMELLESVPVSYLVVHDARLGLGQRAALEDFLRWALDTGRLRFVRSFGARDDLYAITKTEPEARNEMALPEFGTQAQTDPLPRARLEELHSLIGATEGELAALIRADPARLLVEFPRLGHFVYLLYRASYGRLPRRVEFQRDMELLGQGVNLAAPDWEQRLAENKQALAADWIAREPFRALYGAQSNEQYVAALYLNAGFSPNAAERDALVESLNSGAETRAQVLLKVVANRRFILQEFDRSFVLLNYFSFLRRNPDDPPDTGLGGLEFWLDNLIRTGDYVQLARNFAASSEHRVVRRRP